LFETICDTELLNVIGNTVVLMVLPQECGHRALNTLKKLYCEMMALSLSAEVIQKIRHCLNTGLVLGTAAFRDQVKALRS
jgi:hypothetical protein